LKRSRISQERGSVMVLAVVALVPILYLAAFAIDVSHWWDYSRNLQNRADAAALAGGVVFGNICLEGGNPGDTATGDQSRIGKYAQLYSGAGTRATSSTVTANLPYTDAQVTAAQTTAPIQNVTANGYFNNTKPSSSVVSPLTLRLGKLSDYWVALNARNYAESVPVGQPTSFTMNAAGSGATFCNSDPTWDLTDPDHLTAGAAGPMLDVKVTQRRLPLFFQGLPGFGSLRPTIHAHARVQLQGEASTPSAPIAVSDTGYTPCVTVYFRRVDDNSLLGTAVLTKEPQPLQTSPIIWDNKAAQTDTNGNPIPNTGPTPVTMPAGANVYVQPYLNNCNGSGTKYDDATNSGVLLINSYGNSTPGAGQAPVITTGGVTLNGTCLNGTDQYFSVGGCNVQVTAHVAFAVARQNASVTAVDTGVTPNQPLALSPNNAGTIWTPNGNQSLTIADSTGQHPIRIDWKQTSGTIGAQTCGTGNGQQPAPCTGSFNVQAQSFGACNGCDQPDDSGPIIMAQLRRSADPVGTTGQNAFAQGASPSLVITLQLAGINAAPATAGPADDIVLRYPVSGNHQTGLIDCGQGPGSSKDDAVVYYGCGPANPQFNPPPLNPLYVYSRPPGSDCSPAADGDTINWPSGNHQDCVATVPGTKNPICPLVLRMTGQAFNPPCNTNLNACSTTQGRPCCPKNNWPNVPGSDPRAVTMIISSASDFGAAGGPQGWLPIRRFATFYITGWDTRVTPACGDNDGFPVKGKRNQQNEAVWGHWINYTDTAGTGNGQLCPINSIQPINCVPVLTR
jgi:hypothetical protein